MKLQTIAAPAATLPPTAGVQVTALMLPTSTVGAQVALVAAAAAVALLVQVRVRPVRLWPGRTTVGTLVKAALMSAEAVTGNVVERGLFPAVRSAPPLMSLVAPVPPTRVKVPTVVGVKVAVQLRLAPAASVLTVEPQPLP